MHRTDVKRRYKTVIEYEKELALMRKKAQVKIDDGTLPGEVDEVAMLMFQNRWVVAKSKLRLVKQFPERENT